MQADELLKAGQVKEALDALQGQVRKKPGDAQLRVFLFQLMCVLGQWERAVKQMDAAATMDPELLVLKQVCGPLIRCEILRDQVFAGKRTPMFFGQPETWVGDLIQALSLQAKGEYAAAEETRGNALDAAPAISGTLNDKPFAWLMDADVRMGPCLEAVIDGRYYWVPASALKSVTFEAPTDLRDLIWFPMELLFVNGGTTVAFMPTRYPGSAESGDGPLQLARRTDWIEVAPGLQQGLGQRLLATDSEDIPLLDARYLEFDTVMVEPPAEPASGDAEAES